MRGTKQKAAGASVRRKRGDGCGAPARCSGSVIDRLSYSGAPDNCQPVNADLACPTFRAPDQSAWHRTRRRGADRARGGRGPGDRPAVPHARILPGPQRPAHDSRRETRDGGDARGGSGAARAAGDIPATLADRRQGRNRHRRTGVFQVHAGSADAARREAAGLRQARRLQRPADDRRIPTMWCRSSRPDRIPGDRAGLAADRRAVASAGRRRHWPRRWTWLPDFPSGTTRRC